MKLISLLFCLSLFLSCASSGNRNDSFIDEDDTSQYGLTSADLEYIKKETVGGKLDFIKKLPKDRTEIKAGEKIYSRHGMALYMWGTVVHELGVKSPELAIQLYEATRGRILKEFERLAITEGYNSYNE